MLLNFCIDIMRKFKEESEEERKCKDEHERKIES